MLHDFKEFISDYLRYILLGLAGILIILIAVFAIWLIRGVGSPDERESETEIVTEAETDSGTEAQQQEPEDSSEVQLVQNVPEVLGLLQRYYKARTDKDYASLASFCESVDQAYLEQEDAMVERYENVMTYSKPGLKEGEYVVFGYVEMKITDIETLVPCLWHHYVYPDAEGNLMLGETDSSKEIEEYTAQMVTDADVQALIADVDAALLAAQEKDEAVAALVKAQEDASAGGAPSGADSETSTAPEAGGMMQANTEVNVRGNASTDGTLYGVLSTGQQVEALEHLDNGWSKIQYTNSEGSTIIGYSMTQFFDAVQ